MSSILMPIPNRGFDPTEAAVPWRLLRQREHRIVFATPKGGRGQADVTLITGRGLGTLGHFMAADANGRAAYEEMAQSPEFLAPIGYTAIQFKNFDALLLPGGHAFGMRSYLESGLLQALVVDFFHAEKPIGAICHGVLLCARARRPGGKSILYGRKTTALPKKLELAARLLTRLHLLNYSQIYPTTVQDEIRAVLAKQDDFIPGPARISRDSPTNLSAGFTVRDDNYLSARWAGDAHRFAADFADLLDGI